MYTGKTFKKYLSNSNPRELIREIKRRPGIYDKEKLEQPRREHKQQLWSEVAENLTPANDWQSYTPEEKEARVDEVQHKWKHLRNHFWREVKLIESGQAHKKRKYIYYNDMVFMKPFVGIKLQRTTKPKVKLESRNDSDRDTDDNKNGLYDTMDYTSTPNESFEKVELTLPGESRKIPRRSGKAPTRKPPSSQVATFPPKELTREQKLVINKFDGLKKFSKKIRLPVDSKPTISQARNPIPAISMRDGDVSFCLSLVPTMRKLEESKRLKAKIEILTILHKYVGPDGQKQVLGNRTTETNQDMYGDFSDIENGSNRESGAADGSNGNTSNVWWT